MGQSSQQSSRRLQARVQSSHDRRSLANKSLAGGNSLGINRPNNNININVGNSIENPWSNRPSWDRPTRPDLTKPNWNNPGWGWGSNGSWGNNWHDHWYNHGVHHHHHHWYNGCWHGYWGSNWYAPIYWGGIGWGLGSWTTLYGYGISYYNPYYTAPLGTPSYSYAQPLVINNYDFNSPLGQSASLPGRATAGDSNATSETADKANELFDQGLQRFKEKKYDLALKLFNQALEARPGDSIIHEVRALALFAKGDYRAAAAALNSLLASAPGMDWTTMSGLYENSSDYTPQLRTLEDFCRDHPNDSSAYFVLAYHYLVLDAKDDAISALQTVIKNEPKDATAKRMLDGLTPSSSSPKPDPALLNATSASNSKPQLNAIVNKTRRRRRIWLENG